MLNFCRFRPQEMSSLGSLHRRWRLRWPRARGANDCALRAIPTLETPPPSGPPSARGPRRVCLGGAAIGNGVPTQCVIIDPLGRAQWWEGVPWRFVVQNRVPTETSSAEAPHASEMRRPPRLRGPTNEWVNLYGQMPSVGLPGISSELSGQGTSEARISRTCASGSGLPLPQRGS